MTNIKLYNEYHLGDHIFNFILFYNIKNYIEQNDITIEYYCGKEYHDQLAEFNSSKNIKILEYNPSRDCGQQFWIGNHEFKINNDNRSANEFDVFYVDFFNQFSQLKNIPVTMKTLEYNDPELTERYNRFASTNDKYADLDFIILNSTPRSNQYVKDDAKWNAFIKKMDKKYKIITSEKVEGINCTCDDKLTVKDIAALSTRAKNIIAINSGVVPGLFNSETLNNIENIYYFDNLNTYRHSKFIKKGDLDELNFFSIEAFQTSTQYNYGILYFAFFLLGFAFLIWLYYNKFSKGAKYILTVVSKSFRKNG